MKKLLVFFIIQSFIVTLYSQKNEFGFHLGGTYYIGDLNPATHFSGIRPAGGITYRRNFTQNIALRASGSYMRLQSDNTKSGFNKYGDISFTSQLIELSAVLEVDFYPFFMGSKEYFTTPFIFGGFAGYYQSPQLEVNDDLQVNVPYSDYDDYKPIGVAMPFGLGLKTKLTDKICLTFEWGMRKTFTDEIDMVNSIYIVPENHNPAVINDEKTISNYQVGTDEEKDWYSFTGVHLTFKIKNKTKPCKIYDSVK